MNTDETPAYRAFLDGATSPRVPGDRTAAGDALGRLGKLEQLKADLSPLSPARLPRRDRRRRDRRRQRTLVRNFVGRPLLCAWDDCDHNGYEEVKVIVKDGDKRLHYVFCSERHKQMHIAGHRSYGNLHA